MRTQGEDGHRPAKERGSEETNPAHTLTLDFQPAELGGNEFLLSCPVCGALLGRPEQTNTDPYLTPYTKSVPGRLELNFQKKSVKLL